MDDMSDDIAPLLKVHDYFQGISDAALAELLQHARISHWEPGDVLHEPDRVCDQVEFVLRGRLKAVRLDMRGAESLFRMIERGEQLGMMIGALGEPVPLRVIALEPSTLLSLDYELAFELTHRHPDLRRKWLTTFAGHLRQFTLGVAARKGPMLLALVRASAAATPVVGQLLNRLSQLGEQLVVFSDSVDVPALAGVERRPLTVEGRLLGPDEIRRQAAERQDAARIIFDVRTDLAIPLARQLLEAIDRAVVFVEGSRAAVQLEWLRSLEVAAHGWREKLRIAWLVPPELPLGPVVPDLDTLVCRDFKLSFGPSPLPWGRAAGHGLERLVHDLRGVRIGLALGGGAARGMSHLGVLKALEESGIVVDMIAGTSAGAMTGVVGAAGFDPDYSAAQFTRDLQPSWIFRHIPHGKHWYLVYKYRSGQFDPMLRKYLNDWRLEQLPIPSLAISVDLVQGATVARNRGDAVHAILESINLPVLSTPIRRHGQALIDGGLVNNLPADVLVAQGCNLVIAVSVTAKMESRFGGLTLDDPASRASTPGIVPTLFRSLLVQNHCLNAYGVQPADLVIEPDVTAFDSSEFMRTQELATSGHAAALEQVPRIRQLLSRLDPKLFGG
jgi:NTE family protein